MAVIDELKLDMIGQAVWKKVEGSMTARQPLEDGWIEDMRQYKSMYPLEESVKIGKGKSRQFFNITRPKTESAKSRISGMLFQTDAKNWGLAPVPNAQPFGERTQQEEQQAAQPQPQPQQPPAPGMDPAVMMQQGQTVEQPAPQAAPEEPIKRMEKTINDQLALCDYEQVGRKVIASACKLGTGVLKGPVIQNKQRRKWVPVEGGDGSQHILTYEEYEIPETTFVPTWDYFPDMNATKQEDCEFEAQRHFWTRKDLRACLKREDFFSDQVKRLLAEDPNDTAPSYVAQLRELSGLSGYNENRYQVFEFYGTLERKDLLESGAITEDDFLRLDDEESEEERDSLEVVAFVAASTGIVLKLAINPMDTGDRPFGVFCYQEDEGCIFGEGVPRLCKASQETINSAWRKINDNSGFAVGPQILVDTGIIEPVKVDGEISWELKPLKLWKKKAGLNGPVDLRKAFQTFKIDSAIGELKLILDMARQFADEETMLPLIAQGEQAGHITKTYKGMEILMNSANDMMRRLIKAWDDNITEPLIRRLYDWNMQFNEDPSIKGDFVPDAQGTSALLLKETQTKNLLQLIQLAVGIPQAAQIAKWPQIFRTLESSMQLREGTAFMTADEEKAAQEAAAQQAQNSPEAQAQAAAQQAEQARMQEIQMKTQVEQQKLQMDYQKHQENLADKQEERRFKLQLKELEREIALLRIAADENKTVAQIEGRLQETELKGRFDRTKIADEAMVKEKFGSGV